MLARCLGLGLLSLVLQTVSADALGIRPECAKMRDPVGCTCALDNGGGITLGGRWYSVRGRHVRNGGAPNQAFIECNKRAGNK